MRNRVLCTSFVGMVLISGVVSAEVVEATVLAGAKNAENKTLPLLLRNDKTQCVLVATVTGPKIVANKERCQTKTKGKLTESVVSLTAEVDHSPIVVGEHIKLN